MFICLTTRAIHIVVIGSGKFNMVTYEHKKLTFVPRMYYFRISRTCSFPGTVSALMQSICMKDYLDSLKYPEEASKISEDFLKMIKLVAFKMTKLLSKVNSIQKSQSVKRKNRTGQIGLRQ